jgi:hypothetical protein
MVIAGLPDSLDANASGLPTCRRIWLADDFPLAGLVGEAVADLKLHREDAAFGWRRLADVNYWAAGGSVQRGESEQVGISLFRRHPPLEYHAACAGHSLELAVAIGGAAEIGLDPEWPRPKRRA